MPKPDDRLPVCTARGSAAYHRLNPRSYAAYLGRTTGSVLHTWVLRLGITIDYGPFAFMDAFDPEFTPNTSDDEARYTYMQQPEIESWCARACERCTDMIGSFLCRHTLTLSALPQTPPSRPQKGARFQM
eukprot:629366-Rhodomonas_salina.1